MLTKANEWRAARRLSSGMNLCGARQSQARHDIQNPLRKMEEREQQAQADDSDGVRCSRDGPPGSLVRAVIYRARARDIA